PAGLPGWLRAPAPSPPPAPEPLRPSSALGEPDPPGTTAEGFAMLAAEGDALIRGRLVHRLLERLPALPPEARRAAADAYLAANHPDPAVRAALADQVAAVLDDPAIGALFGPSSRAEVQIVGRIATPAGDYAVSGQIDRLALDEAGAHILDFKTNRAVPESAEAVDPAYVLQLALYRRLLADIVPGRPIAATLVYTAGPRVIPVPEAAMEAALARIGAMQAVP
ncbi:PD-(D/E)XK nuclease family protein, partial [Propylenella binzhouense]